jgi:DNA-binding NtrC family response regulator
MSITVSPQLESGLFVDLGEEVLVVDDDPVFRQLLAARIEARGAHVSVASSVYDAIVAVEAGHIDLVISDNSMPGGSGLDLLAYLVTRGFAGRFVLMSGELPLESAQQAWDDGCAAISKWDLIGYL